MEHLLLELERRFWVEASGDLYRELMADGGLMVLAEAGVLDKPQTVAAIESAGPWEDVVMREHVIPLTDETAALVYEATGRRRNESPYRARVSSIYVLRSGHWLLALHHQSPLM
jgi:hypothetical protein